MLTIKSQGLTLADLRTSPIRDIIELFIKYQSETRDEILHGMPRVLALGSDLHPILEGTEWGYVMQFINRHYTLSVYRTDEYHGSSISEYTHTMHPLEVIRITETEEGR
jgi:hypothetical protein